MKTGPTTILIVDDSALYRQSIHNVLRGMADTQVVGVAGNGVEALEKIVTLDPDLLTLDVQMPDMDGIEVLREIKRRRLRPKAIMVSSLTSAGAQVTTDALLEGAFDFVLKPASSDSNANRQQLHDALQERILAFREASSSREKRARPANRRQPVEPSEVVEETPAATSPCRAVILGCSTGGPEALKRLLPRLPADLSIPVFVVQHMPAQYTRSLAARLNDMSEIEVVEAEDKMVAAPGKVVIAAGGKQMKLENADANRMVIGVTDDPAENGIRPSVDYFLRSVVTVLSGNALAVIMTGMGRDGLAGCRQLKQAGGHIFAQSQEDCIVYGMPKAVIEDELPDRILPLGKIAPAIVRHIARSRRQ